MNQHKQYPNSDDPNTPRHRSTELGDKDQQAKKAKDTDQTKLDAAKDRRNAFHNSLQDLQARVKSFANSHGPLNDQDQAHLDGIVAAASTLGTTAQPFDEMYPDDDPTR